MFTGIIEDVGTVLAAARKGRGLELAVSTSLPVEEMAIGASIAVAGACLTVVRKGPGRFFADVSEETAEKTTLARLSPGARVNLERALSPAGRLDGHLVYGHVDGTGTLRRKMPSGEGQVFQVDADPSIMKLVVYKGSIAVDGVSLTVSRLHRDGFEAALIPHTLSRTTLGNLAPGDAVNLETDIIARYVLRFLEGKEGGITIESLRKHGFA